MQIAIIDTGSANLNSVVQAFKRLGFDPQVSNNTDVLKIADRLVLPGVGTAISVMSGIEKYQLRDFILNTQKPLLGICLGLQTLALSSDEVPLDSKEANIPCLGIIKARVKRLEAKGLRLPHMGWNTVHHTDHPLFDGIKQDAFFYYDHSFAMELNEFTIGSTEYQEIFTGAVAYRISWVYIPS